MSGPGVGHQFPSQDVSWTKRDVLLFANSIGAKADELHFLYELHPNFTVFPTYPIILPFKLTNQEVTDFYSQKSGSAIPGVPTFDSRRVVDGQRKMTFLKPLPVSSEGRKFELRSSVVGVYDKGKAGSVVETEQQIVDKETGEIYTKAVGSGFFVGQGNWGGPKGPATVNYPPPQGKNPDVVYEFQTDANTPLLYRLNGDYNPLHATPEPGQKMGFGGVIIHGLFSWNMAAHAILKTLGGSDPKNIKEFQARFASPVIPGVKLITQIWRTGKSEGGFEEVVFVVKNGEGKVVLSNGRALSPVTAPRPIGGWLLNTAFDADTPSQGLASWSASGTRPYVLNYYSRRIYSRDGSSTFSSLASRDNCQCNKCIHPDTRQRLVDTFSIPPDIHPSVVRKLDNHLEIEWANDCHTSTYSYNWLSEHHLNQGSPELDTVKFGTERQFVSNDPNTYPTVLYDEVMSSDDGVRKWTDQIYRWGFSFVKGSPPTPEATEKLLERIAFIRPTHYGGFWDFTSDLSLKDMAYTTEGLGGHTDTTYFTDPAGLQMFHMLSHTNGSGGESLLVDGFEAAKTLYKEDPEAYKVLKEFGVSGHASGNEHVCIQPARPFPVLNHHPTTGELYQVRWNNEDRRPIVNGSPDEISKWYEAARKWNKIIMRKDMERWFQLDPGSPMIFDNWRMLHGRAPFSGKRRICGGYTNKHIFYALLTAALIPATSLCIFLPSPTFRFSPAIMSTLEDLEDLEREDKDKKDQGDNNGKAPDRDGDAEMKDLEADKKKEEEEDLIDEEILRSSTRDIINRRKLLENDMRIMKSEFQRLSHEQSTMQEKIKDNLDKIENNRQLPYLVGNVVELLDLDVEKEAAEEGANIDLDATRVGKSAVIKTSTRQTIFLPLIGLVDHEKLKPGDLIGVNKDSYLVLDTLPAEYDSRVKAMEVDEKPTEKYTDVGGLDKQIEELVEAVVWPMKEAERFKKIGIKAPKGALMYGPPGTGKTLLARACAAQTNATFLKLAGPQLVQMFIGDGAKLVRDCFALAKEKAPSIIFIDELDAVGTKRFDSEKSGDREVQRTMLELLNQLDGFASDDRVKVLAATNRVDVLDPALLRSGRLDRKIEFPLPNEEARAQILRIHSRKMAVDDGVNWAELARSTDEFGGAQLKAVCVEAGMIALRKGMNKVGHENYVDAIAEVMAKKKDTSAGIYV
ncbi:26S protease regulatory subunit 6A [Emergomyces africanus]|uniref:26S proteasome regulatory subunit 6A n=1 Tax=Emergomyces africanus TaxID=1955775 RepID=A0A1B7P6G3_9EURO|nr:26S protease regulatory subunit 6A [Emergomyces africanus]